MPFPASGNPTAIICPSGKLTNDGIWKSSENLCRGYAALRVRLRPRQYENGTQNCSKFIYPYYQTGGGRGFAVSRKRETAKICPKGKLTNDGIWKSSENPCRGYATLRVRLRPHQYENGRQNCSKFIYPYHQNRGAVEALPFPASGNPSAIICPKGKLTNDGIWKSWGNLSRGYAALRVRLHPHQ